MQVNNSPSLPQSALDLINKATQNNNTAGLINGQPPSSATQTAALNQNEFLTLMLAQLKAQDPIKPVDSTAFLGFGRILTR